MSSDNKRLKFASEDEQQHIFMVIDGLIVAWDPTVPLFDLSLSGNVIRGSVLVRMDDDEERCQAIVDHARKSGLVFPSHTAAAEAIEQRYPELSERFVGQIQRQLRYESKAAK